MDKIKETPLGMESAERAQCMPRENFACEVCLCKEGVTSWLSLCISTGILQGLKGGRV